MISEHLTISNPERLLFCSLARLAGDNTAQGGHVGAARR
eukprot:COSAG02_NODE_23304_length_723_cov_0.589744_1_plen_38_part_10